MGMPPSTINPAGHDPVELVAHAISQSAVAERKAISNARLESDL
jgi:hypothetical protein